MHAMTPQRVAARAGTSVFGVDTNDLEGEVSGSFVGLEILGAIAGIVTNHTRQRRTVTARPATNHCLPLPLGGQSHPSMHNLALRAAGPFSIGKEGVAPTRRASEGRLGPEARLHAGSPIANAFPG